MPQPMGAPRVYDAAVHAAIVARVQRGERVTTAGEAEGVSARTVSRWMACDSEGPDGDFCRDATRARAQFISGRLAIVSGAEVAIGRESDGSPILAPDPKFALELLARTDPENFAPSSVLVVKAQAEANRSVIAAARGVMLGHPEMMTGAQWFAALLAALLPEADAEADDADEHAER